MANWSSRRVKNIKRTMEKIKIPQDIMGKIGFNDAVLPS